MRNFMINRRPLKATSRAPPSVVRKVGVVVNSLNDVQFMQGAIELLTRLGIDTNIHILNAHVQPHDVTLFAQNARSNHVSAILCCEAHMASVIASNTTLPVIGVPTSDGHVELFLKMSVGVPVGVVAIDNSTNAGMYVAQMLSIFDNTISDKLDAFRVNQYNELRSLNNTVSRVSCNIL